MPDAPEDVPGGLPAPVPRTVAVRYQPGVVGESRRQAHLACTELDLADVVFWTTACGEVIPAEVAEVSHQPAGMPCLRCLVGMRESGELREGA